MERLAWTFGGFACLNPTLAYSIKEVPQDAALLVVVDPQGMVILILVSIVPVVGEGGYVLFVFLYCLFFFFLIKLTFFLFLFFNQSRRRRNENEDNVCLSN